MQECRLAVEEIACRRGDRILFRGLSIDLRPGEALHVKGPNGVGKSSLLRILAGLLPPAAGSVARTGEAALLDERAALDPHLPLARALGFWARLDGAAAAPPGAFGLADLMDVPVRYLSTGQKKRAALARLAAQRAPIWLLDEPLNGLDDDAAKAVLAMAAAHRADGGLCVVASHQPFALPGIGSLQLGGPPA